jgi:excinuclease ABC subunit A
MKSIVINKANIHNLKNVSVEVPLHKLVVVVGPSGSGKTSLIYDLVYKFSKGEKVDCGISKLPPVFAIGQKVVVPKKLMMSLGEYNLQRLDEILKGLKKDDLLIVDEPCAGLSVRESGDVLEKLKKIVKEGKSVIAIEHSKEIIKGADYVIEFGPKSGKYGGEIIFQGSLVQFKKSKSVTADYVFLNKAKVAHYQRGATTKKTSGKKKFVTLNKVNKNNLENYTFKFPLRSLVCVFGDSGTGKTTILGVVYSTLFKGRNAWKIREKNVLDKNIVGKQNVRRTYLVDQSPIATHPTSRPVTYLGIWDSVRDSYANLTESKKQKLVKSDYIVTKKILDGVETFSSKVLSVKYKGVNIRELLMMTIDEAIEVFSDSKLITRKLGFLQEVGLGYLTLGQKSDSLSGGEAQRVRLAKVLSKKLGDRCVYILDTPTKGLHLSDLPVLVNVLQKIIDKNNTVLVADNKIEIIKNSDYVIDMNK